MSLLCENFFQYAMRNYDNPHCKTIDEFNSDLMKFMYLKKLFNREDVNPRLILNHIVTLLNVFEQTSCVKMLFYKVDSKNWGKLKTYLVFLSLMPEKIDELNIVSSDLALDKDTIDILRTI